MCFYDVNHDAFIWNYLPWSREVPYHVSGYVLVLRSWHGECIIIYRFFDFIFRYPVNVPSGIAQFPNEFQPLARTLVGHRYKRLIQYTNMPAGGHFAAMEEPKLLGDDVFSFVHKVEHLEKMEKWKSKV